MALHLISRKNIPVYRFSFIAVFLVCSCVMLRFAWSGESGKAGIVVIQQDFSEDPGWEGMNNRVECENCPEITQDFGWAKTNHTGAGPGEIGGTICR